MKISDYTRRMQLCSLLLLMLPLYSFSQADTSIAADTASKHSLYAGAGYGSNMIYLGSTISGSQPFGYGSVTYGFNNEFSASVSVFHLSGNKPFMAFYSGSLNYNHVFNSWFDFSSGLSGYKISPELAATFFDDFLYGDATLGIDWKLIYSQFSAGLLIYNGNKGYFQIKNSRYFQTPALFNSKFYISFDPYINFLFGNIITAESIGGNTMTLPFNGKGKGRPQQPATIYNESFSMIETDMGIPVSFNFNRLTIEAEPGYVFPAHNSAGFSGSKGFVFLLSGYFRIF